MLSQVGDPQRSRQLAEVLEEALAGGDLEQALALFVADPGGAELLELALRVERGQHAVAGAGAAPGGPAGGCRIGRSGGQPRAERR